MGCDIHCYIEYAGLYNEDYYDSFGGEIYIGRDYNLFNLMAGVRSHYPNPVIAPRGIPSNLGFEAGNDYHLMVNDEFAEKEYEKYTTQALAEQWVKNNLSQWVIDPKRPEFVRVTHPDWHTPSWLTREEIISIKRKLKYKNICLNAITAAMKELGPTARLVFWFDN